jgi:hypothetical protein
VAVVGGAPAAGGMLLLELLHLLCVGFLDAGNK